MVRTIIIYLGIMAIAASLAIYLDWRHEPILTDVTLPDSYFNFIENHKDDGGWVRASYGYHISWICYTGDLRILHIVSHWYSRGEGAGWEIRYSFVGNENH